MPPKTSCIGITEDISDGSGPSAEGSCGRPRTAHGSGGLRTVGPNGGETGTEQAFWLSRRQRTESLWTSPMSLDIGEAV